MLVKDVIKEAGELVGIATAVNAFLDGEKNVGEKVVETLLTCYQLVENELALDYYPLVTEEEIATDTGKLDFEILQKPVVRFLAVRDVYGKHLPYDLYVGYLKTEPGILKIKYTYTPTTKKDRDGVCECALGVSSRMMAYGVASEYCFISGLYEEGEVFAKKYREAIASVYRVQKSKTISSRRWV